MRPHAVHAVIAVKSLDRAKSRLADRLRPEHRAQLVLAMLADTVSAAVAVPQIASVTVVTPDPVVAELAGTLGAVVHPEPRHTILHPDGLNTALTDAATALRHRHGPVELLALQADLPALRPDELSDMLTTAPVGVRSVVVDHAGSGTAALFVRDATAALDPRFGPGSAHRHIAAGAVDLVSLRAAESLRGGSRATGGRGDWPGLRLDVDTAADLDRAIELGAGDSTCAVLHDIGWPIHVHERVRRVC